MIVAITGATGFLGPKLIAALHSEGHSVRTLGRRETGIAGVQHFLWDAVAGVPATGMLEGVDAVYNLIGEPVAQRWNAEIKQRIRNTRVQATANLVSALVKLQRRPATLISASAIGFYGDRGDEILTEESTSGGDFLGKICVEWEQATSPARNLGIRVVLLRTGIVLGADGGALKQMVPPFRAGVGGPIGSGKQWVSWIHVDDMVGLLLYALHQQQVQGPINATAPNPVRNSEFANALGHALSRPSLIPVPVFGLKLMFGEAATVLLASQRVLPQALLRAGFPFRYTNAGLALSEIYS
ncbi:MAG: TIGR01777 family protein [Bryobacteraceae bacterium]|nr:TIGR01777 family protein [Bryobacteraceae bacterium]